VSDLLLRVAREHGTPCFVYFPDAIRERLAELRAAFGGRFGIRYALKANPHPALLARLREDGLDSLDVSSAGELARALHAGYPPERIGFTGPAKRDAELALALERGVGEIVLESPGEAERLDARAARGGARPAVLVRISPAKLPPAFGVRLAGRPSPFGVDEEDLEDALARIAGLPHLELAGFHVYAGTQCLRAEPAAAHLAATAELFRRAAERASCSPRRLVFGAGFGIPYHEGDGPLDLPAVARAAAPALEALAGDPRCGGAALDLELGRYLVGEAGVYLTRVVHLKESRGTHIAVCDGGMHHHLAACGHLGSVIPRNYPLSRAGDGGGSGERLEYDVCGPLCTAIDTLARAARLPRLREGDVLAVAASGAYGLTASPVHFLSHPPPKEILVEKASGAARILDVSDQSPVRSAPGWSQPR